MEKTLIIFGGGDFEESAARKIAISSGLVVASATFNDIRCHAGNAYQANGFMVDNGTIENVTKVIIFECNPLVAGEFPIILQADHHNPGDFGYGIGAERFFDASSLGQLMNFLGIEPNIKQLMVAAGDHCPVDAYAGKCLGIDRSDFAKFRISQKLEFYNSIKDVRNEHKNTLETLTSIIEEAKRKLLEAPIIDGVRDLRSMGYIDELPEAALSLGVAFMSQIEELDHDMQPTGNIKILLSGCATPETITKFMEWGNSLINKVNVYGNPTRGYAGVVIKSE